MKYSFLVPVYNVEKYIKKCVDSLVNQDYQQNEFEIILIDDGSTDSSGLICDQYAEKYTNIRVVHKRNEGLLQARKTGIENTTGEYVVFVDSDDYVDTDMLSRIDSCIGGDRIDFIIYSYYRVDETTGAKKPEYLTNQKIQYLTKQEFLELFVSSDRYNGIAGKIIKTDILKDHLDEIYSCSLNVGEDKLQTAYLLKYSSSIAITNDCYYYYLIRANSIIHNKTIEDIYEAIDMYDMVGQAIIDTIDSDIELVSSKIEYMNSFLIMAINGVLDHIYKYNKNPNEAAKVKIDRMRKLMFEKKQFFLQGKGLKGSLKIYNIVRFKFLIKHRFRMLYWMDTVMAVVQRAINIQY